jgi:hypothetical protein
MGPIGLPIGISDTGIGMTPDKHGKIVPRLLAGRRFDLAQVRRQRALASRSRKNSAR